MADRKKKFFPVCTAILTDAWIRKLPSSDERWMYFSLLVHEKTSYNGVLRATVEEIAFAAEISQDKVIKILNRFQKDKKIIWDKKTDEILMINYVKNSQVAFNPGQLSNMTDDFFDIKSKKIRQEVEKILQKRNLILNKNNRLIKSTVAQPLLNGCPTDAHKEEEKEKEEEEKKEDDDDDEKEGQHSIQNFFQENALNNFITQSYRIIVRQFPDLLNTQEEQILTRQFTPELLTLVLSEMERKPEIIQKYQNSRLASILPKWIRRKIDYLVTGLKTKDEIIAWYRERVRQGSTRIKQVAEYEMPFKDVDKKYCPLGQTQNAPIKELKFKPIPIEELLKDCYVGEEKVKQTLGQILKS